MSSEWVVRHLGELAHFENRKRVPLSSTERAQRSGPYPYWGANGVLDHVDGYLFDGTRILVGEDGTVRRPGGGPVVHWVAGKFWVNNHAHVLWTDEDLVDPRWLYYALTAANVDSFITGAVQPKLSMGMLKRVPILVPSFGEQRTISAVLGALDDKIDSNRRLASLLEETAATLFRGRFVDFVGATDLIDSEAGRIPSHWRVAFLSDVAEITMGQSPPSTTYTDEEAEGLPLVQGAADFGSLTVAPARFCTAPTRTAPAGSVLMTVRAPVGRLNLTPVDVCIGRGVAALQSEWPSYLWLVLSFMDWRSDEAGTIFPAVTKQQVHSKRIAVPPSRELREFEAEVGPLLELRTSLSQESLVLAAIRDNLLPALVSGRLRLDQSSLRQAPAGVAQ